jgi:acyl dehydratase
MPDAPDLLFHEDFPVGQVLTFGRYEVTREEVLNFAAAYDPQPFHLDDEAAAHSLFGRLAASGWHTCAMAMRMMCDGYLLRSASLGSPGLEDIRWKQPVYPGDVLGMRMTILESRPMRSRPGVGLMRARWEVLNQDGELCAEFAGWGMFRRRTPVEAG